MKKYYYVPEAPRSMAEIAEMTEAEVLRRTCKKSIDEVFNSKDSPCTNIFRTEFDAVGNYLSRRVG